MRKLFLALILALFFISFAAAACQECAITWNGQQGTSSQDSLCIKDSLYWSRENVGNIAFCLQKKFDLVSDGPSWHYCDSLGDGGNVGPNGIRIEKNGRVSTIRHDFVCYTNVQEPITYESIYECIGDENAMFDTIDGFYLTTGQTIGRWKCLSNGRFDYQCERGNVASRKSATALTNANDAIKGVDGNLGTKYASINSPNSEEWVLSLEEVKRIDVVKIAAKTTGAGGKPLNLYYWNGDYWIFLKELTESDSLVEYRFNPAIYTSKINISSPSKEGSTEAMEIYEVEILCDSNPPTVSFNFNDEPGTVAETKILNYGCEDDLSGCKPGCRRIYLMGGGVYIEGPNIQYSVSSSNTAPCGPNDARNYIPFGLCHGSGAWISEPGIILNSDSYICMRISDNAGNMGYSQIRRWWPKGTMPGDNIPPEVSVWIKPSEPKMNDEINISGHGTDDTDGFNIKSISLFLDDAINPIKSCDSPFRGQCTQTVAYADVGAGGHVYWATAVDQSDNEGRSEQKTFTILGSDIETCGDLSKNAKICNESELCMFPGIFINSSDGGKGTNEGTGLPGGARCCSSGQCIKRGALLSCNNPAINGKEYDPAIAECTSISPALTSNPSFLCCKNTPSLKTLFGGFGAYWSRQTSFYTRLTEASEGDNLFCIAKDVTGQSVNLTVKKGNAVLVSRITAPETANMAGGGTMKIAKLPFIPEESGTYTCVVIDGANTQSANLPVTEGSSNLLVMPFFGFEQFIIALGIIIIYQLWGDRR